MTLSIGDVVDLEIRPPNHTKVRRSRASSRWNRRQFLRMVGAASAGLGVAALSSLPPMRVAPAGATHETPTTYHSGCTIFSSDYDDEAACNGCLTAYSLVSSSFCGSDGWHHGSHTVGQFAYKLRPTSCNGRNAWYWTLSACCWGRKNRKYRCSDGERRLVTSSTWVDTVCKKQTSSGTASGCPQ